MARQLVAGLHLTLDIDHHHRENSFCLADDLMEPFRPLVDQVVVEIAGRRGMAAPMDTGLKQEILASVTGRVLVGGEQRTVFEAAQRAAVSLAGNCVHRRAAMGGIARIAATHSFLK